MTAPPASFDLDRFVVAQSATWRDALAELQAGQKRTHWSWYIFPQWRGLGASAMSVRYAIGSLDEAVAYLAHDVLGPRLRQCVLAVSSNPTRRAEDILGDVDAQKFRSCLTLFSAAAPGEAIFRDALDRCFGGEPDAATLALLAAQGGPASRR